MSIHKLPPHVIRRIAAGEVIDRPYSVVKELLENALDAQATRIEIELEQGGLQLIKVTDNGGGIHSADLPLVFERYATSKLHNFEDLLQLSSYGFRGEALYAIATVAEVTIQTKTITDTAGSELRSIRGKTQTVLPVGHRVGTSVIVRHLFESLPVRHKTIQPKKEVKDILHLVQGYSIEFPKIQFSLTHQGKNLWSSFSEETAVDRLAEVWNIQPTHGITLHTQNQFFKLSGWISTPEHFVSHRKHMYCFINHRLVDPKIIFPAIHNGLKTFSHRSLFPQFYISLEIPTEFLDLNLHPQKKTVKFLYAEEIFRSLTENIVQAFTPIQTSSLRYTGSTLFPEAGVQETTQIQITGEIVQLHDVYLVVPTNQGFLLVDQHAADERLWYNRLLQQKQKVTELEKNADEATLTELADDEYMHSFEPHIDATVAIIACHTAIRAGQILTQTEMQRLVKNILEAETDALVCPHGRPTYVSITLNQLARMFRR